MMYINMWYAYNLYIIHIFIYIIYTYIHVYIYVLQHVSHVCMHTVINYSTTTVLRVSVIAFYNKMYSINQLPFHIQEGTLVAHVLQSTCSSILSFFVQ